MAGGEWKESRVADSITCPKCGAEIPFTEAITRQIEERLRSRLDEELREREQEHAEALTAKEAELKEAFAAAQAEREAELAERAAEKVATELAELNATVQEKSEQLAEARSQELALRKEKRKLEEQREALELEVARRIDEERTRIVAQATERLIEEHRLRLAEKELMLEQMKTRIEELSRASEQTRAGLQGEVLERDIEDILRERFPSDQITAVKSGARGADVVQIVRSSRGAECGKILWELKRAGNWSNGWISKLKEDQKAAKADIAVLVSGALPENVRYMEWRDEVWLADTVCVTAIATALRAGLIELAQARSIDSNKNEALDSLYEYLCGRDFRQRIVTVVETFVSMKNDLDTEKRSITRTWTKRERQLDRLALNTAGMYGDLQGIMGAALPPVELLELPPAD